MLVGFVLTVSPQTYAADECDNALNGADLVAPMSDLDKHFSELAKQWKTGWTDRGFLGLQNNSPVLDAESYMYALKNGLMWWNLRVYFVKSVEEAKAHEALVEDTMVKGVYILGADESEVEFKSEEDADKPRRKLKGETLRKVLERTDGFIELLADGSIRKIPMTEVNERLNFDLLTRIAPDKHAHGIHFFAFEGWAATKKRGLLYYENMGKSSSEKHTGRIKSSSIQRSRSLAQKLIASGYQIKVNGDFQTAINMARDQMRFEIKDGVKTRVPASRYQSLTLYQAALAMYEKGLAFSVELYRPDGKMVAGSINFVVGNLMTGDTIFHDLEGISFIDEVGQVHEVEPIDAVKAVDVVTFDQMANGLGIRLLDVGMVSDYSETLKADYVPRDQYLDEISKLPKEPVRLPSILDPYEYPDLNFAELAKGAKIKGITKSLFLGGMPLHSEYAKAQALKHNLVPAELAIFVVKDSKEAEEKAQLLGYMDNAIYFMNGQHQVEIPTASDVPANDLVHAVMRHGAVTVDPVTGKVKVIQGQRFKNILNQKLSNQYMSWRMNWNLGPHVIVKGWKLQQ